MIRKVFFVIILIQSVALCDSKFADYYLPLWERACAYTLEFAEAMPAEKYDFKPVDEVRTYAEQLGHIVENLHWLNSKFIAEKENSFVPPDWAKQNKQEIINRLKKIFVEVANSIKELNEADLKTPVKFAGENLDKEQIVYLMRDHMTHHRGQLVVYLRLNGIKPPQYRGW